MLESIIMIGGIGIATAIADKLITDNRTKTIVNSVGIGTIGTVAVVKIAQLVKELIKITL